MMPTEMVKGSPSRDVRGALPSLHAAAPVHMLRAQSRTGHLPRTAAASYFRDTRRHDQHDTDHLQNLQAKRLTAARRFVFESAMPVARLVRDVADRAQEHTQRSWKRPYGVGLLVAGFDKTGMRADPAFA